jgi:hypothetical protein
MCKFGLYNFLLKLEMRCCFKDVVLREREALAVISNDNGL